jgi:murein DD-endopeptidase MepM/ murein hydrolase activator NlpD
MEAAWVDSVHAILLQRPQREQERVVRRLVGNAAPRLIAELSSENVEAILRELSSRAGSRQAATLAFFAGPAALSARAASRWAAAQGYPHAWWLSNEALRRATLLSLVWPVASAEITSPFGWRYHPVFRSLQLHRGVDIAVREGSPVRAAGPGVVRWVREDSVSGRWLAVDHGFGVITIYCHNSEVLVRPGQRVEAETVISHSGSTGLSTGPHLHFQVQEERTPVDLLALHEESEEES